MASDLGQQTVELSTLVSRAAHDSYSSLKELTDKCRSSGLSDSEKKISILKFLNKTQQRMIRLNVISKWCQQVSSFSLLLLLPASYLYFAIFECKRLEYSILLFIFIWLLQLCELLLLLSPQLLLILCYCQLAHLVCSPRCTTYC